MGFEPISNRITTCGLSGYRACRLVADSLGPALVACLSLYKETVDELPKPKVLCVTCLNPCWRSEWHMGGVPNGASGKPGNIPEYVALHWHRELCQCWPYISPVLVGSKMKTIELESKQGADSSADLPTQPQPQLKIAEPKPSTASSDEEKLVAGVSMIGLQTKRLSGAQRRKLIRERTMKEGTWKDWETSRKNPFISSQESGQG